MGCLMDLVEAPSPISFDPSASSASATRLLGFSRHRMLKDGSHIVENPFPKLDFSFNVYTLRSLRATSDFIAISICPPLA